MASLQDNMGKPVSERQTVLQQQMMEVVVVRTGTWKNGLVKQKPREIVVNTNISMLDDPHYM